MNGFQAFKPILLMLAVLAVALLVIAGLVNTNSAQWIIPPPEVTAEGFVSALGAHRYQGALEELSQDLQVSEADLQELLQPIEQSHQGIQDAHGDQADEQGDTATASVRVKLGDNQEKTIEFTLKKENGLWKLTSIEPIRSLAVSQSYSSSSILNNCPPLSLPIIPYIFF